MISKFRIRTADIMIRIALYLLLQFTKYNCSTTGICFQTISEIMQSALDMFMSMRYTNLRFIIIIINSLFLYYYTVAEMHIFLSEVGLAGRSRVLKSVSRLTTI